jgi:hypothetical protein
MLIAVVYGVSGLILGIGGTIGSFFLKKKIGESWPGCVNPFNTCGAFVICARTAIDVRLARASGS